MSTTRHVDRRIFLKKMIASGAAFTAAVPSAPAILAEQGAGDRIGVAVIGVGTRGFYLMKKFQEIPGVEIRVICDLYQANLKRAREACTNDRLRSTKDWQRAIADRDVDVVVRAIPALESRIDPPLQADLDRFVAPGRDLDFASRNPELVPLVDANPIRPGR